MRLEYCSCCDLPAIAISQSCLLQSHLQLGDSSSTTQLQELSPAADGAFCPGCTWSAAGTESPVSCGILGPRCTWLPRLRAPSGLDSPYTGNKAKLDLMHSHIFCHHNHTSCHACIERGSVSDTEKWCCLSQHNGRKMGFIHKTIGNALHYP